MFDSDEVGIDGVRVELYDASDKLVAATTTDSAGNYRFTNLMAGEYTVREIQPAGMAARWTEGRKSRWRRLAAGCDHSSSGRLG